MAPINMLAAKEPTRTCRLKDEKQIKSLIISPAGNYIDDEARTLDSYFNSPSPNLLLSIVSYLIRFASVSKTTTIDRLINIIIFRFLLNRFFFNQSVFGMQKMWLIR